MTESKQRDGKDETDCNEKKKGKRISIIPVCLATSFLLLLPTKERRLINLLLRKNREVTQVSRRRKR